jgi:hypothetical protein
LFQRCLTFQVVSHYTPEGWRWHDWELDACSKCSPSNLTWDTKANPSYSRLITTVVH